MTKKPDYHIESTLRSEGFEFIAGIDEAGRGALAGPLVASCVILNERQEIESLHDSKLLSVRLREAVSAAIKSKAIAWSVGLATVAEINKYGIQPCTYLAFRRAIFKLPIKPDHLLIDYYSIPNCTLSQTPITKGDQISTSIAAASVIAKVHRDDIMRKLSDENNYSKYQVAQNKGYGTKTHLMAIRRYGPSKIHRMKFIGIDKRPQTVLNLNKDNKKGV